MRVTRRGLLWLTTAAILVPQRKALSFWHGVGPQALIPANRLTTFKPGVTYNGVGGDGQGIRNRTTIYMTLNPLGGNSSVSISLASPAVVTGLGTGSSPAVAAGTAFIFQTTGVLPTGVSPNQLYYVLASGLGTNSFSFASSPGGTAINSSGSQSGTQSVTLDDAGQINTALSGCPAGQVVLLGAGTFLVTGNGLSLRNSNITLRGQGPGPGAAISTGAQGPATAVGTYSVLWKGDTSIFQPGGNSPWGVLYVGNSGNFGQGSTSINLTTDAVQGANSCQVASTAGLSVGQLVLIDHNTDRDPNVFWGNANDPAGTAFTGSVSGTSLTINSFNTAIGAGTLAPPQFVFYSGGFVGQIASGSGLNWTLTSPGPTITNQYMESGNGTRRFFCRQERSLAQMMKISNINGNTVTFETPFHFTHPVSLVAQLSTSPNAEVTGVGIENLCLYAGNGGDGNGNMAMAYCSYSWVKNVESHWANGTGLGLYNCYRCEIRDSYMHETPSPNPGGGGYLCGLNTATADSLVENSIMWCGNKVIVMRATGGGNVIAYNYMDDAFGAGYPMSPEAGINAAHFTTSHMELLEGNYSHQFKADAFWGNSIYITVFRNWLSGLRAAANVHTNFGTVGLTTNATTAAGSNVLNFASTAGLFSGARLLVTDTTTAGIIPPGTIVSSFTSTTVTLNNNVGGAGVGNGDSILFTFDDTLNKYAIVQSGTILPYIDSWGHVACDIQAHSYFNSIAGNVLGFKNQPLLGFDGYMQVNSKYEDLGTAPGVTGADMDMYRMGLQQDPSQTFWIPNQDNTILRQGNWDWITQSQRWHGIGGPVGSGPVCPIPNSYYLGSKPAFWGSTPWPWVDPSTGTTYTLPALARFASMTGATTPIPPGNQ